MKIFAKVALVSALFFFGPTALAKFNFPQQKSKVRQCAVFQSNAKKAKKMVRLNQRKAKKLTDHIRALFGKKKRTNTRATKKVVATKIKRLKFAKKKSIFVGKKYRQKQKYFEHALRKTCAQQRRLKRPKKFDDPYFDKYADMSGV